MRRNLRFFAILMCTFLCIQVYSQNADYDSIEINEASLATKHWYAVWRTDYYICTGIAYAKSMGQSVEEFVEFVAARHSLTGPNDTSLAAAVKSGHFVMTCYPNGEFQIISESDSTVVYKVNRPYRGFFRNGPVLGVTMDEFEKYLYGHVVIMAENIGLHCEYQIKDEEVMIKTAYKD